MKINSLTVHGFKNLVQPITFGPLQPVSVLHGANNVGKSNLIQAIDIFFRLMGSGSYVGKDQSVSLDSGEQTIGFQFSELFHLVDPTPIEWQVEISIKPDELEEVGMEPEYPTEAIQVAVQPAGTMSELT